MKLKQSWKIVWIGVVVVLFLVVFFSFQGIRNPKWQGQTMGTSYSVAIAGRPRRGELKEMKAAVEARLAEIDNQMSTWNPDSRLSRFNRFLSTEPFPVTAEFVGVVRAALEIAASTDGAFDPTVKPLVDHWGFGPEADSEPVAEIMKTVGWEKLRVDRRAIKKAHPELQLDLSAIAKGYGVDALAEIIHSAGFTNFLVEIGGEVITSGTKENDEPWLVGIQHPDTGSGIFQALELSGGALATSGGYRNFRVRADGTRYSHIIDPVSGMPAESDIASVSVIAPSCMEADAVATALFVMGSETGFQWLETRPELEALLLLHATNEPFTVRATPGFPEE